MNHVQVVNVNKTFFFLPVYNNHSLIGHRIILYYQNYSVIASMLMFLTFFIKCKTCILTILESNFHLSDLLYLNQTCLYLSSIPSMFIQELFKIS